MRKGIGITSIAVVLSIFVSSAFAAPPVLEVSPLELNFTADEGGSNPADQILSIWRGGGNGPLDWEVTEDCNWLSVEPNSGKSMGEVDDVNVIVDISGLTGGEYYCQITVAAEGADNSPQVVNVNLEVIGPVFEVSPGLIEFTALIGGPNPADKVLSISNTGGGTLNWNITEDCSWLSAEPNTGSSTGEVDDVNLSVDITGLTGGIYDCNLTVFDANASNSPQVVGVTLTVRSEAILYVPSEHPTIQGAIDAAVYGNTVVVLPGTYTGDGNRDLDFGGKGICVRSTDPEDPCVVAATIIDCENVSGHRGFYFHSGEGPDSVVSGLTIKNGRITGSSAEGGGIYCSGASPTIENCTIISNQARGSSTERAYGGGIYCSSNSDPEIFSCTISNNIATGGYGSEYLGGGNAYGGGIFCSSDSHPTIENCIIANNTAEGGSAYTGGEFATGGNGSGGGIYGTEFTVWDCRISSNRANHGSGFDGPEGYGGGIYFYGNSVIDNCLIVDNSAGIFAGWGGGIRCGGAGQITNCTIYFNSAANMGGGIHSWDNAQTVTNCIIWNNTAFYYPQIHGSPAVLYSDVQGGYSGAGVIDSDPCFVSGPEGDYYLSQISAGQLVDSPCVDAGSDTAEALGLEFFTTRTDWVGDAGTVDMGYHYAPPNPADFNRDGVVNFLDFAVLGDAWMSEAGDLNWDAGCDISEPEDEVIDGLDLGVFVGNWLEGVD